LGKDPWLAVFLSLIVHGAGHLYLRKWIVGILLLLVFLPLWVMSVRNVYAWIGLGALRLLVSAHAYIAAQSASPSRTRPTIAIILLLVGLYCLGRFLLPLGVVRSLVYAGPTIGRSMTSTIPDRSRIVVDRLAYRRHDPALGDIVAFTLPDHPLAQDLPGIKRIVARGGETVHIRGGIAYVDGRRREPCKRIRPPQHSDPFRVMDATEVKPYFAHGVSEPYHVPQGCYFLLGDNRWDSVDSRCYGAIPRPDIIGKVVKVLWPLNVPPLYDTASEQAVTQGNSEH
jgi:signal peptidase I